MTGPTIVTSAALPTRRCSVCGAAAVAGTGVARSLWWCSKHLEVGLAGVNADLVIARVELGLEPTTEEAATA